MNCPKCNSPKFYRSGTRKGKPARKCADCGFNQVNPLTVSPPGRPKQLFSSCPHCGSDATVRNGRDRHGQQRHHCKNCGKNFAQTIDIP